MSFGGGASLGTAEGRITVDASQAISELGQVGAAMSSLDAKAGTVGTSMGTFKQSTVGLAQGMQNIGRVGLGLGAALSAPFIGAAGAALDLESTMAGVNAVMDLTGTQFEDLQGLAQQLGKDTIFSGNQAAQGIETLGRAGISAEDILDGAAQSATDLAAAGGIEVPRAAEVMAAAMQAFNIQGEDSIQVADALAGVANSTLSDINQLGIGLGQVAGVASAAGMGLEETTGFIGLLADNGIRGSDAATSMKNAILSLLSPTDKAAGLMADMGVEVLDASGNFIGLAGASQEFFDAWKGSGQTMEEFLNPLNDIVGRDAVRTILFGMQAIQDGLDGTGKSLEDYFEAASQAGAAQEFATKRMDSTAGALEKLKGSIVTLGENIGMPIIQGIRGPVEALTEFTNVLASLPSAILAPIGVVGTLAGAIVALGGGFLLVGGYVLEATARFGAAGISLSGLIGPALAVAAALAAVGIAIAAYQSNFLGFADGVNAVADALGRLLGIVDDPTYEDIGNRDQVKESGRDWNDFEKAILGVSNVLSRSAIPALADFGDFLNTNVAEGLFQGRKEMQRWLDQGVRPLSAGIKGLIRGLDVFFGAGMDDHGLIDFLQNLDDAVESFAISWHHLQLAGELPLVNLLASLGVAAQQLGLEGLGQGLINAANLVTDLTNRFNSLLNQGFNPLAAAIGAVAGEILDLGMPGLSDQLAKAANAAQAFGNIFERDRQALLQAGFPEVAADIAAFGDALLRVTGIDITGFTAGMANAIFAANDAFQSATRNGVNPFLAGLQGIDAALDTILSPDQQAQLDAWSQSWQDLNNTITSLGGEGLARVTQFFDELGTAISTGDFSGAATAIESMFNDIRNALGSFAQEKLDWAINIGVPQLLGWWEEVKGNVGAWLKEKIEGGVALAGETLAQIQGWLLEVGAPQLMGWIQGGADLIGPQIQSFLNFAGEVLGRVAGWILEVGAPELIGWIQGGASLIAPQIQSLVESAGQTLGRVAGWILEVGAPQLAGWIQGAAASIKSLLSEHLPNGGEIIHNLSGWILEIAAPKIQEAEGNVGGFKDDIIKWINDNVTLPSVGELPELKQRVQEFSADITKMIVEAIGSIGESVSAATSPDSLGGPGERGEAGTSAGAESQWVDFGRTMGEAILTGIGSGLAEAMGQSKVAEAIRFEDWGSLREPILEELGHLVSTIPGAVKQTLIQTKDEVVAIWNELGNIGDWLTEASVNTMGGPGERGEQFQTPLDTMLSGVLEGFDQFGADIQAKIAEVSASLAGIADPFEGLVSAIQGFASAAGSAIAAAADPVKAAINALMGGDSPLKETADPVQASALGAANVKSILDPYADGAVEQVGASGVSTQDRIGLAALTALNLVPGFRVAAEALNPQGAAAAPGLMEETFSGLHGGIAPAVEGEVSAIGETITTTTTDAVSKFDLSGTMGSAMDTQLAAGAEQITLEQFSTAIGTSINEAIMNGVSGSADTMGGPGVRGEAGTASAGIGNQILTTLTTSIEAADFTPIGKTIGAKIQTAVGEGLVATQGQEEAGRVGAAAAGGIGTSIVSSLNASLQQADFAPVGATIQSKISAALAAGMTTEAAPAGGGVAGGGAGIGASVASSLAAQITSADFSAVGAAISIKISEAVSLGMAGGGNTMGGPGERVGAGGGSGIGAAVVQSIVDSVSQANFSEIGTTIKTQLDATITEALSGLGTTISQQFVGIQSAIDGAVAGIQASMQAIVPAITGISASVGAALQGMSSTVTTALSSLQASIDSSVSAIQASIQAIVPAIEGISGAIQGAMATMTSTITSAFAEMQASVDSAVSGIQASVQAIIPALEGVAGAAGAAAASIGAAIVGALDAAVPEVAAAAARLGAAAVVPINTAIQPGSPSKVVLPWAESIPEALVQGMQNGEDDVKKAGVHLGKSLIGTSIGRSIQDLVDSLKGGSIIADQLSTLGDELGSVRGMDEFSSSVMSIADEVSSANQDIGNSVKDMIANIRSKLKQGAKAIRGDAQSIGSAISSGASAGAGPATSTTTAKPEKPNKDAINDAKDLIVEIKNMQFNIDQLRTLGEELGSIRGMDEFSSNIIGIADSMETEKDSAIDSAVSLKDSLKAEFRSQMKDYHQETRQIGKAVSDGITEGIQSGTAAATDAATGLGEDVAGGLNANLSRLPEMGEAMGEGIGTGVSDGMNSTLPAVQGSGEAVGQALDTGLQNGGSGTTQTATDLVTDTTGAMSDAAAGQSDFSRTIGELISQTFGEGFAKGANPAAGTEMVTSFGQGIRDAVNAMIPSVQQNGTQIGSALTTGVDQINPTQSGQKLVGEVGSGIQTGAGSTTKAAGDAGTQIGTSLTSGVESACGAANNAASDLTNSCIPQGINSGLKDATGVAQNAGQSVSDSLMNGLDIRKKDVERNFGNAGTGFTKAMGEGIGGSAGEAVNKAQGVAQAAGKVDGSSQGKNVGVSIGQGIAQGVDSTIPAIRAAVEKAVQEGIDAAKEKSKSESPSKVFAEIGSDFSLGLAMGIEDTLVPIANAARGMVDAATGVLGGSAFTDAERSMIASVGSYTSSLTDVLEGAADKLTDTKFMRKLQGSQFNGGGDQRMRSLKSGEVSDGGFNLTINGMNINPNTPEGRALMDMAQILRQTTGQYANR